MIVKKVQLALVGIPESLMGCFDRNLRSEVLAFEVDILDDAELMDRYDFIFTYGAPNLGANVICLMPEDIAGASCFDLWTDESTLEYRVKHFVRYLEERYMLKYTENALEATVDTSEDLIWHKSVAGIHLLVNKAFCEAVGKEKKDIVNKDHYDVWNVPRPDEREDDYICVTSEDVVIEKRRYCIFDEDVKIRNSIHRFTTGKSPLFNLDGEIVGTVGVGRDITMDEQHRSALIQLAMNDALTGLYNRNYVLEQVVSKSVVYQIAFLDLNFFKEVNDRMGHDKGDEVLYAVAVTLSKNMSSDIIARWGGDEFLVIRTSDTTLPEDFEEEVERLVGKIDAAIAETECGDICTVSAGCASREDVSDGFESILKRADERMYEMKERIHAGAAPT